MEEKENLQEVEEATEEQTDTEQVEETEEKPEEGKPVPYKRFKQVNDRYKAVKDELETVKAELAELKTAADNNKADESEKEKSDAEEEPSQETVANQDTDKEENEVNPLQGKVDEYEGMFAEMLDKKLESVPEEYRKFIPEGDTLSKLKWVESAINEGLFTKKVQSFGNKGFNPEKPAKQVTSEQFKKMSATERTKLYNDHPELYEQLRAKK